MKSLIWLYSFLVSVTENSSIDEFLSNAEAAQVLKNVEGVHLLAYFNSLVLFQRDRLKQSVAMQL